MKILLGSPDQVWRTTWQQELSDQQFIVDVAADDKEMWGLLKVMPYDLLLLESVTPALNGLQVCRRLRALGNPIPILLVLAASDRSGCVQALNSGVDICLNKPFDLPELLAHIHALARRGGESRANTLLKWWPLSLDPIAQSVTCHGQLLKLNRKEYQLLELFLRSPRQMFSRRAIGDRLWNLDDSLPTDATIKSHIRNIRRKLEQANAPDMIQTHYGQGYCLKPIDNTNSKLFNSSNSAPPDAETDTITAQIWQSLMAANSRLQQEVEFRKAVERQLRCSETRLRNAQRAAQVGCWEFDILTREVYWSEELYYIHGLDPSQPAPTPEQGILLIHPDDRWIYEETIRAPALRGEAFEANLRIVRDDDGAIRHINARGGPIWDNTGNLIQLTGTTLDVTRWIERH